MGDTHTWRDDERDPNIGDDKTKARGMRRATTGTRRPKCHGNQILIVWSTLPVATTFTNLGAESAVLAVVEPLALASVVAIARRPHVKVVTKCPWACTTFMHLPVDSSHTRIV